jgi:hypothetical protein
MRACAPPDHIGAAIAGSASVQLGRTCSAAANGNSAREHAATVARCEFGNQSFDLTDAAGGLLRLDFLVDATARGAAMRPWFAAARRRNFGPPRMARLGPRSAGAAKFKP